MIKRTVAVILIGILIVGTVGCSSKKEEANNVAPMKIEVRSDLPGEWSRDYTREEVTELHNEILARVEENVDYYGLREYCTITEEVKENTNGVTVNDNHINVNIEDPEPNRLESMYYGFRQYGSDLASGDLTMKISSVLDKEAIKEEGTFDFGATSFATFSKAFTGVEDRDYTDLNEQVYNMIVGNGDVTSVENNLDGIRETISISDNFLLYTLQTKEYKFK